MDDERTIGDVINEMSDEQRGYFYELIECIKTKSKAKGLLISRKLMVDYQYNEEQKLVFYYLIAQLTSA